MRAVIAMATLLACGLTGGVVGRATAPRPRPCPVCPSVTVDLDPVRGDLDELEARLDRLDARCVLLPERDRLAVVAPPKKAVP